jgi:uncharacterized protein (DUF433 family)
MAVVRARVYPRIDRDPLILGGEPKVRGTRLAVRTIVVAYWGWNDVDRVLAAYPELTRHDVEDALSYYREHQAEVESYVERDRAED